MNPTVQPSTLGQHLQTLAQRPLEIALLVLWTGLIAYFFGFHLAFGPALQESALTHLESAWNSETEYEHAYFIPFIMVGLLWMARKKIASAPLTRQGAKLGLVLLILGILFYIASIRTIQWRVAIGSLTFVLFGSALYGLGWRAAKHFLFPIALFYFAVPVPGLLQGTNLLQLIATKAAYQAGSLFGVDMITAGNNLASATDKWGFDVAEGCSGLRSLMALTLVGAIYAYTTQTKLWKGLILFASTIPLAIIANSLRITTIVIIAEYVDADFAGGVYHDWSGFLFFLACGLAGLILIHRFLEASSHKITARQITRTATPGITE
ncbi:MAG: exosortase [Verrucomicrobiaceae bacterium]|nr:exosortase [Verrucomicrobiaceae bacterium]